MEISPAVASELALLSRALTGLPDDLARRVKAFSAAVKRTVPSYLGLTLRLRAHPPVHLTSMVTSDDTAEAPVPAVVPVKGVTAVAVGASLLIPRLGVEPHVARGPVPRTADPVTLVLYAVRPGAFVDLAADLALLTGNDLADVVLDRHLTPPPDTVQVLEQESTINQAIGVLIGSGQTPEQARAHLDTQWTLDHIDRWTASTRLLEDLLRNPPLGGGLTQSGPVDT